MTFVTFVVVINFLWGILVTNFESEEKMLKGWVRFVASKEPRNQYLLSVFIDLEGDSYERFTKCNILDKQLCLHWQFCIPNELRLLIPSLWLSNKFVHPYNWNFITAPNLLTWFNRHSIWVAFFYLLKMAAAMAWFLYSHQLCFILFA